MSLIFNLLTPFSGRAPCGTGIQRSPERATVEAMEIAVVETVWFTAAVLSQQLYQGRRVLQVSQLV